MQTIDPALQKAVWERVLGHAPAKTENRPEAGPPTAELLRFLEDERDGAAAYRRLSRRLWGQDAALLRRIAEEARMHCQVLHAAYFAETGQRANLAPQEPSSLPPAPEALLSARNREREKARTYEEAAKRWPSLSEDFQEMAEDKRRRAQCLHVLLGRLLCGHS